MSLFLALVAVLLIASVAAWLGYSRARQVRATSAVRLHSLPAYHGACAALWAALPALLLLAAWVPVQTGLVNQAVLSSPQGQALPDFDMQRESILIEAREIASGQREAGFNSESSELAPVFVQAEQRYSTVGGAVAIILALAAAVLAVRRSAFMSGRTGVERWLMRCWRGPLIAILTTLECVSSRSNRSLLNVVPRDSCRNGLWPPNGDPRGKSAPGRVAGPLLGAPFNRRNHAMI